MTRRLAAALLALVLGGCASLGGECICMVGEAKQLGCLKEAAVQMDIGVKLVDERPWMTKNNVCHPGSMRTDDKACYQE